MPEPEYQNIPRAERPEPESAHLSLDCTECSDASSVGYPDTAEGRHEESIMELAEQFIEQDRDLGHDVKLLEDLKGGQDYSAHTSTELIDAEKLAQILEDARKKGIPYSMLESLWDLWSCHPEDVEEPPIVRAHALSDVIRPMWEQGLEHELKSDLLFDLEGEENMDKLHEPQPQSEIDDPQNLYQVVRTAWDHNRMEELLAMIEENDYALIGETIEEGAARYRTEIDEFAKGFKERMAKSRQETT